MKVQELSAGKRVSKRRRLMVILLCLVSSRYAAPSSLSPTGTKYDQHVAAENDNWFQRTVDRLTLGGVIYFGDPVHEEITNRIYGCKSSQQKCDDPTDTDIAGPWTLAGVRWNDDPPFQLQKGQGTHTDCKTTQTIRFTTQPVCWVQLFKSAKKGAANGVVPSAGTQAPMLARSHFGDLQFLHAMATQNGETAADTQKKVLMWIEFNWKVATGVYNSATLLKDVDVEGFGDSFGKSGQSVQDLLTLGNPDLRPHVNDVAFGSVLHTVEDSFAKGHVQREERASAAPCSAAPRFPAPARIVEFHSYIHQDERKHAEFDNRSAFEAGMLDDNPNVVSVGQSVLGLYRSHATWESVKPYFQCVFDIVDAASKASPGKDFAAE